MPARSTVCALAITAALACLGALTAAGQGGAPEPGPGPLSPEEALRSFELEPGYRIDLVAAEPLVRDPVAMAFDERGRLFVVESRGYPGPLEGSATTPPAEGTIALLDDRDGDGRFDTRTEFAGGLTFPNGILPWDGGVFVTCAPDLLYLRDTTGDGVADERRVVLTGFDTSRTPQIRFSHPTLGLDNWIYFTSGLAGGNVRVPDRPERPPVEFTPSDSRFDPRTQVFELTGGLGQFGLTFDDYGRRFVCSNRHPVMHVVLEPRHLRRNPHLAFSQTAHEVSAVGAEAVVWPISTDMTTAGFHPDLISTPHAGTFTAASGVHVHRGGALPAGHEHSIFICESAQNLVQRQVLEADGMTFRSRPARSGREFLATRDSWFRPVFAANGPDGALYVVDMYRRTIDHPQYVPEASRALLDFEAGRDRGRIYRIAAADRKPGGPTVAVSGKDGAELAAVLDHPNAWWRETAQRLIVSRRDQGAIPRLRALAASGRRDVTRIHALWTLDGLGALDTALVAAALKDAHAGVRENAAKLAGGQIAAAPELLPGLAARVEDEDVRVRLQAALALGESRDERALASLAALARRDGGQDWMRAAILSSVGGRPDEFLRHFVAAPASSAGVRAAVLQDLARMFGAGQPPERCLDLIMEITAPGTGTDAQIPALSGLAAGLKVRRGGGAVPPLLELLAGDSPQARQARARVERILGSAAALARETTAPLPARLAALGLLAHTDHASAGETLNGLLQPHHASEIQVAAARALAGLPDRDGADALLRRERWLGFTPQVRESVLATLLADERGTTILLDAIEQGRVTPGELGSARRRRLSTHRNPAIQSRARAVLGAMDSGNRMAAYERLRAAALARPGEAGRGRDVFSRVCAACHTFDGAGGRLGPDLSGIRHQPADAILLHVVVPDYEITPGYQGYLVETRDGRTLAGRLESEAPNSLTLRDAASQVHQILRRDVVSIAAAPASLMPAELERAMTEQELADLLAYLKSAVAERGR